jgi:hypothetical protein
MQFISAGLFNTANVTLRKLRFFYSFSALGPTQPPVQWVPGGSFSGGKARPGRDADRSSPSSAEVKKEQELYLLSPKCACMERNGTTVPFLPFTFPH